MFFRTRGRFNGSRRGLGLEFCRVIDRALSVGPAAQSRHDLALLMSSAVGPSIWELEVVNALVLAERNKTLDPLSGEG